jgi:hypothetical protein
MIGAGLSYWLAATTPIGLVLVVICMAINWFGDSLDGTLARVRRQPRLVVTFLVAVGRHTRMLYLAEPVPPAPDATLATVNAPVLGSSTEPAR